MNCSSCKTSKEEIGNSPLVSKKQNISRIALSILVLTGLLLLLLVARNLGHNISLPEINSQASSGMIFLVGLLTGLHCIGMCGSFIIGYTAKDAEQNRSVFKSHVLYGAGKTLSYTMFGLLFGFVGSLVRITPLIGGISIGIAGAFLILYGLNMLHIFSFLKAIRLIKPKAITHYAIEKQKQSRSPFLIGFFSGFILGCGPLQVMYIMAAGNGVALEGAKFLALFGLGTLPALFGFGLLTRILSNKINHHIIYASGIILIIMGSIMLQKGVMRIKPSDGIKCNQTKCHCIK